MADYVFSTTTAGPIADAKERVVAALATEGFGVLTEIDVSATMKAKLDVDVDPYLILGACNPPLAHRAITAEPSIGALLPCNVVLRQSEGAVVVDFMDPASVLTLVDRDGVAEIAAEVRTRLDRVRSLVSG
ncbi:MAG: DUF302 domain-containing protein [bacterium]|nr:DUF302 domain-containing protein [bacterium]MCP4968861.1 DUF302 domain-containing protein [bacterium]